MALLLVGCQNDAGDDVVSEGTPLRPSSVTRAGSHNALTSGSIQLYVMAPDAPFSAGYFSYNNTDHLWANSGVRVKENTQYYIYGYMPHSYTGSIDKLSIGDYSAGAKLTISDLPLVTEQDICAVVGVQRFTAATETSATEGNYGYLSGLQSENYVNLLLDHLYSRLNLQFNVDAEYYKLRRIHLKQVVLKAKYAGTAGTVTATVQLLAGHGISDGESNYVSYSAPEANPAEQSFTLLSEDHDLPKVGSAYAVKTVNCPQCLFNDGAGAYLSIESTYDVYDTAGKITRANCKSVNKVNITGMLPGVSRTLTLTVAPTYLYVLGDNDVDNPTVVINN